MTGRLRRLLLIWKGIFECHDRANLCLICTDKRATRHAIVVAEPFHFSFEGTY